MRGLRFAARLAARELRHALRGGFAGFRIFLLCLALGVAAIAAVGSLRAAIETGLAREGRVLLGGDAALEMTFRRAGEAERAWLAAASSEWSEVVEFRSMAGSAAGERALTQVKAVDAHWPLIGAPELAPAMPMEALLAGAGGVPGAAMDPVLIDRLGLSPGERFDLGGQDFVLMAALHREPDDMGTGFALGPRTLVGLAALEGTGLMAPGSMFDAAYRLELPEGVSLAATRASLVETFHDAGIRWRDASQAEPGFARFVDRLGAFLVLVGLAGLAVGGVGVSAAVRSYLEAKTGVIATLKTLGAGGGVIFATYFLEIGALAVIGVAAGLALGAGALLATAPLIAARLPVPFVAGLYPAPLLEAACYGLLTALVFTLLPLGRLQKVRAAAIFRGLGREARGWPRPGVLVALGLSVAALVGAAVWFSGAWPLALGAAVGIAGALGLLALAGLGLRALARGAARARALRGHPATRLALAALGDPREGAVAVVVSLGLGLSVLAATGQIDANLRSAIAEELPDRAPALFFLDIQPDQRAGFENLLAEFEGVTQVETAPQLRGVVSAINGIAAREWGDHWVLRGDRGLTYAARQGGFVLTEGAWWPEDYAGPPLVSFGAEEAAELGLALGDRVTVNVLGRDITATIANFRAVDFRTGGIGFVMVFDPQAFAGAPHTLIATAHAPEGGEGAILRALGRTYPTITAIAVSETARRFGETLESLASATALAALAVLGTGLVVLIGAAAAGERGRVFEAAVLKVLGARRGTILASFALRAALTGAAAGAVALAAGALGAWAVLRLVMDLPFTLALGPALGIVAGGALAVVLAGLGFALRPLAARPAGVLRGRE